MESLVDTIIDFVRERQLNIAVAGVLTLIYMVYQYWGTFFKGKIDDEDDDSHPARQSRSRSRSASRSRTRAGHHDYKADEKHRRRKRRCPDCSLCNYEQQ